VSQKLNSKVCFAQLKTLELNSSQSSNFDDFKNTQEGTEGASVNPKNTTLDFL
jgi:hypothetical protein